VANSELGFNFVVLQTERKQQMVHTTLHVVTTVLAADGTNLTPRGHHYINQQMVYTTLHVVTTDI
jgi:hypothetical protein